MKRILILFFLYFSVSFAQSREVYIVAIDDEIDLGMAPYVKRVINDAEKNKAKAIIFRINTFGGRVDAATQIKDAILNSKVKTVAFIDKRAISAGALIAISCEKIIMTSGASIGASTVVDQAGKKQSEKYQSFMRSEMRAAAEKNNRKPEIAEGMVDERIVVEGLVDSTKLITLTTEEALKFGYSDTTLNDLAQVLSYLNLKTAKINQTNFNVGEEILKFINNPIVSSLLIMIGLVGLFTEVKTPGWGVPGTAGVIALTIFFGAGYILELASAIEILLFVIGFIMLIVEIFVIPGFGFVGVGGIIMMIAGLFLGLISDFPVISWIDISNAIIQLALTFVFTGIFISFILKFLPKTEIFSKLVLSKMIDSTSGYISNEPQISELVGKKGKTLTDLRPSGTAQINNDKIDVVSESEFVLKNSSIVVVKVEGSKVVVRAVE
ncbi:MAG: peptidase [Ignavibacteriales bacterium CG_4_9_14_3_um_filter_34_10]|nr:MAG: peptidase [Ignavibacteriales bacterium CG_4_9_14_3_um_filter_34_10]